MTEDKLGKVIHYFDKAMVAVVKLDGSLKVGEAIKISRAGNEFAMKVESMQINHQPIMEAKAGEEVAIKLDSPTKEGALVYKVEE